MEYIENNYKYCQELSKLDRDHVISKIKEYSKKSGVHITYCTDHAQELYCQIFGHKYNVELFEKITEDIRQYNQKIKNEDQFYIGLLCTLCQYHKELIAREYN